MRNGASWEKKEKACTDEEKEEHGDQRDHVVIDAESKAVISMVCGKRTKENTAVMMGIRQSCLPRMTIHVTRMHFFMYMVNG